MKNHQNAVNNHPADWRDFLSLFQKTCMLSLEHPTTQLLYNKANKYRNKKSPESGEIISL